MQRQLAGHHAIAEWTLDLDLDAMISVGSLRQEKRQIVRFAITQIDRSDKLAAVDPHALAAPYAVSFEQRQVKVVEVGRQQVIVLVDQRPVSVQFARSGKAHCPRW